MARIIFGMKIFIACPAPAGSRKGNRVTADRWARFLKSLGHRLTIDRVYDGLPCDVLIALHARKSYEAVQAYRRRYPRGPLVVALTGTDLYRDIRTSQRARQALALADRLVVLQALGGKELRADLRSKVRVIYQSAEPVAQPPAKSGATFKVCVLGHLRREKDPFRTALAARRLPASSKVQVVHLGEALSPALAARARVLETRVARYRWLGEVPRWRARRILVGSHLLALTSRMEGGANVISEALADGVPVLASRIPGSEGILGSRYPGFFPVADTEALARLLFRAETDARFYKRLKAWCQRLAPLVEPARERQAWADLLDELVSGKL